MEQPNFYAIIPANIRYSKEISMFQKLLYAEITALTQKDGYCWASNKYFAELYEKNEKYISEVLNDLSKKGFLKIFIDKNAGNKRSIYIGETRRTSGKVATGIAIQENLNTYSEKSEDHYSEKPEQNNTSINNKNNKRKNIKKEKSFFNFFEDLKILKNYKFNFEKFVDKNGDLIFKNENFCEELQYFYEMRKEIKAPMSARALELLSLKARFYDLDIFIKMIQQSTENSWKGIFELKNQDIKQEKVSSYSLDYDKEKEERLKRLEEYKKQQNEK